MRPAGDHHQRQVARDVPDAEHGNGPAFERRADLGVRHLWRVLRKPSGQLLLIEHMRPGVRPLALLTDLANGPWLAWNGRCHLNRETQAALVASGFEIDRVEARLSGLLRLIVAHTAAGEKT
jgi:hypothetical protein